MSGFQALEAHSLILSQTVIALLATPWHAPNYNFPLFLFGLYASERTDSADALRAFAGFLTASEVLDIIWLAKGVGHYNGWVMFLVILNMFVKIPTILASLNALRLRGDSFAAAFTPGQLGGNFSGGDAIWSLPGGFPGGRDGYQNVDDDLENNTPPPRAQTTNLPHQAPLPPKSPAVQPQQASGGYQTL